MKNFTVVVLAAGLAGATLSSRADLVLDFQAINGTFIGSIGSGLAFVGPSDKPYFQFTGAGGSSATGDSVGDTGVFSFGMPVPIASINAAGTEGTLGSGYSFRIADPGAPFITMGVDPSTLYTVVNWSTISFSGGQVTMAGKIGLNPNYFGTVGVYTGTQADLQTLANSTDATITISFKTPFDNLNDMVNGILPAGYQDAPLPDPDFSGQIFVSTSVLPEPTTVVEGALLLLPFGLSAVQMIRKHSMPQNPYNQQIVQP